LWPRAEERGISSYGELKKQVRECSEHPRFPIPALHHRSKILHTKIKSSGKEVKYAAQQYSSSCFFGVVINAVRIILLDLGLQRLEVAAKLFVTTSDQRPFAMLAVKSGTSFNIGGGIESLAELNVERTGGDFTVVAGTNAS
jgi:hypothetical protein